MMSSTRKFDMDRNFSRRHAVEKFGEVCREVLSEEERLGLHKLLSNYHRKRRVERLVPGLFKVIQEENRMEIIHLLRQLIPYAHLSEFDRHIHQRRARGQLKTFFWEDADDGIGTTVSFDSESESDVENDETIHEVTLQRDHPSQNLGFSIRGGSEHGLGVYVSDVTPDSLADRGGVLIGDKLLLVNGTSVQDKSSSIVGSLLTRDLEVNMTLEWTGHLPKWRLVKEKTAWFDYEEKTVVCGEFEKCGAVHYIKGLDIDVPERRVTLANDGFLGLNIRGGSEFGLGIYVSSLDPEGQAERQGVKVGDQIVEVNGIKFDTLTHAEAVDVFKSQEHIIVTLRDVRRYPAFKEVYGKYSWTKVPPKSGTRKNKALHVKVPVEVFSQRSHDPLSDGAYNDGLPLQSEIYLPSTSSRTGKEKAIDIDSDVDDLDSVNLKLWKDSEGFQNPAYVSEIQKIKYNSSTCDEESDTDNESGIKGEYCMTKMDTKRVEEFELTDLNQNGDTSICIETETGFADTLDAADDEAIYIAKPPQQFITMTTEKTDLSENSYASDSCSINLSCSPETRRYTAWSDDEIFNSYGEVDSVSPVSSRRSRMEDSGSESRMGTPDVNEYQFGGRSPSPVPNILPDSEKDSTFSGRNIEFQEPMEKSNTSHVKQNPSVTIERHESTGFDITDEEAVVMRSFDTQIDDFEGNNLAVRERGYSTRIESSSLSSSEEFKLGEERLSSRRHSLTDELNNLKRTQHQQSMMDPNEPPALIYPQSMEDGSGKQAGQKKDHVDGATSPMTEISGSPRLSKTLTKTKPKDLVSRNRALGNWKLLREKVKGSLRIKPLSRKGLEQRLTEISRELEQSGRNVVSSTKYHKSKVSTNSIKNLEEVARKFLNPQELSDMLTQIRLYHERHDLDRLLEVLLAMLDTPEKVLLLREIRSAIYPVDIYRFELSVSRYEKEAYEKLSTKLHLYLNHDKDRKPKKHLLHTETDENGHFYVKSVEQFSREQNMKKTVIEALSGARDRDMWVFSQDSGMCSTTESVQGDTRSDVASLMSSERTPRKTVTANISKNKQNLGLCVSGGIESKVQPEIKVEQVLEGGAAADEPAIQPGMVIQSIDGHSMVGVRHAVAVDALRMSFGNKRKVNMTLVLQSKDV